MSKATKLILSWATIAPAVLLYVNSAFSAPLRDMVDITDLVVSNAYAELFESQGFGNWSGLGMNAYYTAIGACEGATPDDTYVPGCDGAELYAQCSLGDDYRLQVAERRSARLYFEVDLSVVSNQFKFFQLEWTLSKYDWHHYGDVPYSVENYVRPLTTTQVWTFDTGLVTPPWHTPVEEWVPWGFPYLSSDCRYEYSRPIVWGCQQTREVRPEPRNPDPDMNVAEPVNVQNGSMRREETDIIVSCPGIPLAFTRTYDSAGDPAGTLGPKWRHSYEWSLTTTNTLFLDQTNMWAVLETGDGRALWFQQDTNGLFSAPFDCAWRLANSNGEWDVTTENNLTYHLDTNGVLQTVHDLWGNSVSVQYDVFAGPPIVASVQHNNGQRLNFIYIGGRLVQVQVYNGNFAASFAYNAQGELNNATRSVDSGIATTRYTYATSSGLEHCLTEAVDPAGNTFTWTYQTNSLGQARCVESWVGTNYLKTTLQYDAVEPNSTTVHYERDGQTIQYLYRYDPLVKRVTQVRGPEAAGFTAWNQSQKGVWREPDDDGNVVTETANDMQSDGWLSTALQFDDRHNPTNAALGYSAPAADAWSFGWHPDWNTLTSVSDPENHRTAFEYANGRVTRASVYWDDSNSYDTTLGYKDNGLLAAITNANGHWVRFGYDDYGRLDRVESQIGAIATFSNNILGRVVSASLPGTGGPRTTHFDVNSLGWVNSVQYPSGLTERFWYDEIGNLTNHVDVAGRTNRYTYAPTRKLTSSVRVLANGSAVTNRIEYGSQFDVFRLRDAKNRAVESYAIDLQGRVTSVTNLEGQSMSLTYRVGKYVDSVTRFDGTTVTNGYDSGGRLASVTYPDSTSTFTYYKNGLPHTAVNETCAVANTWDAAGRLTEVQVTGLLPDPLTVDYDRDPVGNATSVANVAGTTAYAYDAAERLTVIQPAAGGSFQFAYNTNNGLVASMTNSGTGVNASYEYDIMDRVTNIVWRNGSNDVLRSFDYQYNAAGLVTNLVRIGPGQHTAVAYDYDSLDRLVSEANDDGVTLSVSGWSYDLVGNRTQKTRDNLTVNYTNAANGNRLLGWTATSSNAFADILQVDVSGASSETIGTNDALGQLWVSNAVAQTPYMSWSSFWLSAVPVQSGTQTFVAAVGDAAGNVGYATNTILVRVVTGGQYTYSDAGCVTGIVYSGSGFSNAVSLAWNGQYQLTGVSTGGVLAEAYGYDAAGRRAWTFDGMVTNYHLYDGAQVLADLDATGGVVRSYVWGPGVDNLLAMTVGAGSNAVTYYPITDRLGTLHALANGSGKIVEQYRFDAWGRVLGISDGDGKPLAKSAVGNRYLWQGREYSWATGFYYFRARWYDPVTGRWLSNDPLGIAGGLNQYVFCANNPVNFRDPFGLCKDSIRGISWWEMYGPGLQYKLVELTKFVFSMGFPDPSQEGFLRWRAAQLSPQQGIAVLPFLPIPGGSGLGAAETTTQQGTQLYRVFGNEARGLGNYYTTVNPATVTDVRATAGLFPGNSGSFVLEGTLNNTEGVLFRNAAPGPGGIGGGLPEVFVPNPSTQINIQRVSGVNPPF